MNPQETTKADLALTPSRPQRVLEDNLNSDARWYIVTWWIAMCFAKRLSTSGSIPCKNRPCKSSMVWEHKGVTLRCCFFGGVGSWFQALPEDCELSSFPCKEDVDKVAPSVIGKAGIWVKIEQRIAKAKRVKRVSFLWTFYCLVFEILATCQFQ